MSKILLLRAKLKRTIKTDDGLLPKGEYLPANTTAEAVERLLKANRIRLETVEVEEDDKPDVSDLDYRRLQALAKAHDIPANQTADELREALNEVL